MNTTDHSYAVCCLKFLHYHYVFGGDSNKIVYLRWVYLDDDNFVNHPKEAFLLPNHDIGIIMEAINRYQDVLDPPKMVMNVYCE